MKNFKAKLSILLNAIYHPNTGHGLICAEDELWKNQRRWVMEFFRKSGMANLRTDSSQQNGIEEMLLTCMEEFFAGDHFQCL